MCLLDFRLYNQAMVAASSSSGCFQGRVFGLTGELPRKELEITLKANGAQISAIIHKRVSFVVCTPGAVKRNTQKARKASKHGIPLVSLDFVKACVVAKVVVDHTSFLVTASSPVVAVRAPGPDKEEMVAGGLPISAKDATDRHSSSGEAGEDKIEHVAGKGRVGGKVGPAAVAEDEGKTKTKGAVDTGRSELGVDSVKKENKVTEKVRRTKNPRSNSKKRSRNEATPAPPASSTSSLSSMSSSLSSSSKVCSTRGEVVAGREKKAKHDDSTGGGEGVEMATSTQEVREDKKSKANVATGRNSNVSKKEERETRGHSPRKDAQRGDRDDKVRSEKSGSGDDVGIMDGERRETTAEANVKREEHSRKKKKKKSKKRQDV